MFSGQGSQYYHMGKELYENHPRFKLWMDHCDEIVHPLIGASLMDVLYQEDNKSKPFDRILYTNPALLCIEYSLAKVLMEMEIQPDYLLGYSLGEITASVISGAVSLNEGFQLTVAYAKLLEKKSPPAAMLAIIESIDIVAKFPEAFKNCWVTGRNFHKSFVVSGLVNDIKDLQVVLSKNEIISQKLPVNYGFHTELMDPLKQDVKEIFNRVQISPIRIPIISALTAGRIKEISDNCFWKVTRHPVNFEKTIRLMLQNEDYIFIDVGPSGTLSTFVKYLLPSDSQSSHFEVMNQFGKNIKSIERLSDAVANHR